MTTYEIKCKPDRFTFYTDRIDAPSEAAAVAEWKRLWRAEQDARKAKGLREQAVPKHYTVRPLDASRRFSN